MKIKFLNKKPKEESHHNKYDDRKRIRPEDLKKMYESPKVFLRKSMEVIEVSVQEQLSSLFEDYISWRKGKSKRPDYIFNMLQDISFVSVLPKIVDNNYELFVERGEEFSEMISSAVSELMKGRLSKSRDMIAIYTNIYEDLNEKRVESIVKLDINGVEWDDALKICIMSHGTPRHTMNSTLRVIYGSVKTKDYKKVRKLLSKIYGKEEMDKVAVYILLEKAYDKQRNSWVDRELYSLLTTIALDEINRHSKDHIKKLMKLYCEERRRSEFENFIRRRINFSSLNKEDYSKIAKVVRKMSKKNEMYRIFLDHSRVKM